MGRKYLGELGVPALPGGFLDVLTYFSRNDNTNNNDMGTIQMSELTNQVPPQIQQQGQAKISSSSNELYGNGSRPSGSTSNTKPASNGKEIRYEGMTARAGLGLDELYTRAPIGHSLPCSFAWILQRSDRNRKYCISMQDQHYFFIFYLSKSEI